VSTLDCMCKNGSETACEQLGTAPKVPKPRSPKPSEPRPVPPLGTGKKPAQDEPPELDEDTKDRCADYYEKCVQAGGDGQAGRVYDQSICGTCMAYCQSNGFWPAAIYTWKGVRVPCPGS
jgi:hypothetical protein